jgi:hypothetical protein
MFVSARKLLDITLVACIAYPTAQCAFGQATRPAAPRQDQAAPNGLAGSNRTAGPEARGDQNRMLQGSVIIGSNVMLQGGASYGTVRDFVISDSGCLEYAVIAADGGMVAVPWGAGMFDVGRRAFTLGFGRDRVRDFPRIRDVAELRDPKMQQRVQTFFRGNQNPRNGEQGGAENRPQGGENRPQPGTVRGAAPRQAPQNNERGANTGNNRGERHEK